MRDLNISHKNVVTTDDETQFEVWSRHACMSNDCENRRNLTFCIYDVQVETRISSLRNVTEKYRR
jgi:hypothetical protein